MVSKLRRLAKAVSWRIIGTLDTFILTWIITGKAKWAFGIASLDFGTKIVLYYIHESLWEKVKWGRRV